jgi:tight adherence protein B
MKRNIKLQGQFMSRVFMVGLISIITFGLTHSITISLAFAFFVGIFLALTQRNKLARKSEEIQSACPDIIDHLISGLQSGLSLNESLVGLSLRGPQATRQYFEKFRMDIYSTGDFIACLEKLKADFSESTTDLIIEALLISHTLGGAELMKILRLLGNFIREDLTLRREITVKQNWIKNSAHLSAGAPWILLLLLSTQPATTAAFSNRSGVLVLCSGLLLTTLAYLWMNHLSQMPTQSRVFMGINE